MRRLIQISLNLGAAAVLFLVAWRLLARPNPASANPLANLSLVIGLLAVALLVLLRQSLLRRENRRLQAALAHQAITDSLTGLANRRRCDEVLALEIGRAERYRRPLSLLLLDVDGFKHYNDRHGHLKGDMLLRVIAGLLREQLRASDTAARYGGDEFVIILPETNANRSEAVAHKLHASIAGAFGPEEGVTIGIGCGAFETGLSPDALLGLADRDRRRVKPSPQSSVQPAPGRPEALPSRPRAATE